MLKIEAKDSKKVPDPSKRTVQIQENGKQSNEELKSKYAEQLDEDEAEGVPQRARTNKFYLFFFRICMHDLFTFSMTFAILVNTLVLAFDKYPITYETQTYLEFVNMILSYIFIAEMVIKLLGMGIRDYCGDSFNIFDGTVVIISIVEMIISTFIEGGLGGGAISSLRAVRLLRVFKLARSWTSFRDLLAKMIITFKDIQFFACLLVLFMFIFTLLGMELFAYRIKFNNEDKEEVVQDSETEEVYYPRASFNTFGLGFTTIFIVFIGEDWNSVMYDHTRSQGVGCILIFMVIFIVGNLIMLNLFLAILLKNFEEPPGKEEIVDTGPSNFSIFKQLIIQKCCSCCTCFGNMSGGQVNDENQVADSGIVKAATYDMKHSEFASQDMQNVMTPRSKKSIQSQHISDKDNSQKCYSQNEKDQNQENNDHLAPKRALSKRYKGIQSKSDQGVALKANTEAKVRKENNLNSEDDNKKLGEQKKPANKSQSEQKKVTLDINDTHKSPHAQRRFLKQRTIEMSEKSSNTQRFSISAIKQMEVEAAEKPKRKPLTVVGRSLWIFSVENPIRKFSVYIVGQEQFDNFILALILISTFMLILESPLNDPKNTLSDNLYYADVVATTLFTIELVLKVIVMGFLLNGQESYIRNPWNIMDFIIVAFSLVSISFRDAGSKVSVIKTLRMLRVLRPLRMISRNQGLKIAVNSLINSIPYIRDVIVVSLLFLLLFAILCTNFFKGSFYSCQINQDMLEDLPPYVMDQLTQNIDEHVQNKFECLDYGGEWVNTDDNFDNVFNSMITLFNIMTTEGWIDVMWTAVDSSQIDFVPETRDFGFTVIFFLIIIFFFHLFILNMFVGIVINVFSDEKKTLELNHLLTQTQLDWCEVLIFCYKSQPSVKFLTTGNFFKDSCYSIAMNQYFDRFILFCIIINTGCLAYTWHGEPPDLQDVLADFNLVFNIIYTIEAIVKLIAFDKDYFKDGWNNFDFIIVIAAWFGFISSQIEGLDIGASTNVIRIFRISRIFKIIKKYKSLRILFYTFIGAIPQLTNVGGLLMLFLFLYSVLGVEWFATVKLQENLTVHANFQTFGTALLTLFRMATGESWFAIMFDCARPRSILFQCVQKPEYEDMYNPETKELDIQGCGDKMLATIYFMSFMLIVSFIFLNLFIAVILESFVSSKDEEGLQIGEETINKFQDFWSDDRFDPKGTKFISISEFPLFLSMIIDEEIKMRILYDEALMNNQIDLEDQVNNKIFMFNIHVPIYKERRHKVYQKMIEDGEIGNQSEQITENIITNKTNEVTDAAVTKQATDGSPNTLKEGGQSEMSEEERIRRKKINDEKKARQEEEKFQKHLDQFIGTMEMPCYDKCKTFYYYDVLEALSRHLFQSIINQKKAKLEEELGSDSDSCNSDSRSSFENVSHQASEGDHQNNHKDSGRNESENSSDFGEKELSERELEDREDILFGSLEEILRKLEEKGTEQREIEKYKEMRLWRQKRDKTVREQLEQFAHDGKKRSIIDSSQLVGARVILKYLKRMQAKKKRIAAIEGNKDPKQQKNEKKPDSENIEERRQARIMEIEVQRKKKRIANMSPDDEGKYNQINPSMPQIQEAENEDKDYSHDNGNSGKKRFGRNAMTGIGDATSGPGQPGANENNDGDAAYSTFQKDSEPGNRQGEEQPQIRNMYSSPQSFKVGSGVFDDQLSQQLQGVGHRSPTNMAAKQTIPIDGSSFDEYHRQESSEMQDIQSLNNSNMKQLSQGSRGGQHQRYNSQSQPNAGD